ncbi:phage tail tape measure protein, partial [Acinetobacter baumannii]
INYLDDNAIASGKDIIDFMQRVGGTASMVKITDKNTAALGSTLLTLGEKAETSATAINAVFSKLGAANTQSKPFRAMVEELGLTTGQLGRGMQTDAIGTIFEVMDKIKQLPKVAKDGQTSQIDAVATLFGAEHWDTFSKLMENRAELEKQLRLSTSSDASGSMSREFKARMETTEAQWQTFKNRGSELAVNIGSVLLPA